MPREEARRRGYLRIRRQDLGGFRLAGAGHLVAAESAGQAKRGPGAAGRHLRPALTFLGGLLLIMCLGVVALDVVYGAEPHPGGSPTVLSQIAASVFQGAPRPVYYSFQFATLLVLVLAANTSFNGFPRLSAILARDDFLPHRFAQLGNRLVYSTAIVLLGGAAAVLMTAFRANTDSLVNLYA